MRPCAYPAGVVRLQGRPRPSDPRWQDRPQGFPKHQSQAAALETMERHALRMHMGTPKSEAAALQTKALPATSRRSEAAALQTTARYTYHNGSGHAKSHMYTCTCTMQQQEGLCGQDFASAMRLQLTGHSMLTHHHQSQAAALETVDRHALRMHKGTSKSEAAALQSKALPATSPRSEAAALQTTARCTFRNVSRHAASHMHTCTCTMHQQGLCGQDFANAMRHQLIGHSMLVRLVQPPHRGAPRKQQPHSG